MKPGKLKSITEVHQKLNNGLLTDT